MNYLRPEVVQRLHEKIVISTGGSQGLREPGMLVAVCEKPQATFGGTDLYPTISEKAAAIFEALVNYHVFVDGNKRTAVVALNYFLAINDHELAADDSGLEKFTLEVATTNPDLTVVSEWVLKNIRKIPGK